MKTQSILALAATSALVAPAVAETPVEKECKAIVLNLLNQDERMKDAPANDKANICNRIASELSKSGAQWTEQDAANLKAGKPLVKDYPAVVKAFEALPDDKMKAVFITEVKRKDLTELQKRTFSDLLAVFKKGSQRALATTALSNGKDLYVAFRSRAFTHGGKIPGTAGDKLTANGIIRDLFKGGHIEDESPLFIQGIKGFNKPDNKIEGKLAAAVGENVWTVNAGINITMDAAQTPMLITPLKQVDGKIVADSEAFGGQVVVVQADGAAIVYPVGKNGEIETKDGNLLAPTHPIWKEKKADLRLPEPLK